MNDSIFVKTGAAVLTAAGVLGLGYGIAKYATDFEAAKAEIQNLRGQIAQLQDLLQKAQFGVDPARVERMERQVAELREQVGRIDDSKPQPAAATPSQPSPAAADNRPTIAQIVGSGAFSGRASNGIETWPYIARDIKVDGTAFSGIIEWPTLNAVHRIEGNFDGDSLSFKETAYVQKGNNVIGCQYKLDRTRPEVLAGTYSGCDGVAGGGTAELDWR